MGTEYALRVTESSESFELFRSQSFISDELRNQLCFADILVVPQLKHRDYISPCFPMYTEEFVHFLKSSAPENVIVDICIEDEDFRILELRDDTLDLAHIIVNEIGIPVIVDSIRLFLAYILGSSLTKTGLRLKLTVDSSESGETVNIEYDGPASAYDSTVGETLRQIKTCEDVELLRKSKDLTHEERILRLTE